ncbi:uncharacterized protein C2845_PM07G13650 [Panicum miliaceum]|uniref:KIB1-4 beta-propeller domain-containing protein n=1 Tax=Panicum miliaceum TaxID=4540 RepID=A0A3L6SHB0_PANMI|nr:uncharacterized protein C2845_PM07G13650 [Panicum miliaceum]
MEARGRTAKATPQPRTSQLAAAAAAAAAEAMAARPSWGNVPDNILVRISAFLRCNADRVYMACASKLWSAAVRGLGRPPPPVLPPLPPLQPQLPWLIFPDTATPDVRRARCCGSGDGGWLVLALDSRHTHALYNLNTGRRIPLPPTFTTPADNDLPLVVRAATISAPPSDPGPYMVAAIVLVGNRSTAAFWSEGSESWFSTGALLDARPQDAIYHGGARTFFFVTSREDVVSFQPTYGWNNNVNLARVDYDMQPRGDYADDVGFLEETGLGTMRRYLVESRGRLLMVVRCFCYESGRTEVIRVFEFRVKPPAGNGQQPCATWKHLGTGLDGRMLFLGRGCSRSFEVARYNVFQESMIYFLDDGLVSVQSVDGRTLYSFTDMGRSCN